METLKKIVKCNQRPRARPETSADLSGNIRGLVWKCPDGRVQESPIRINLPLLGFPLFFGANIMCLRPPASARRRAELGARTGQAHAITSTSTFRAPKSHNRRPPERCSARLA